jgi:ferric-dicitrate binding protein FerR (iron transport regulator)
MTSCDMAKNLIEKVLEVTISEAELDELKSHAETCEACREELQRCNLVEEVVKDALVSHTAAEQARTQVVARLVAEPRPRARANRVNWVRTAVAAGIILGVGLLLGFLVGRVPLDTPSNTPSLVQVPMQVGTLEGTVLVKHESSDVWQPLQSGAVVYLGDMFHSTPRSGFVLELEDNKSTIEVNQNSMLALTSYDGKTEFSLVQGECTASLESPHGPFFVSTPQGRVEALGTEFTVTVE